MGKTKRNHPCNSAPKLFSTINAIEPFTFITDKNDSTGGNIRRKECDSVDLSISIPQHILWEISSHKMSAIQELSNFFARKVYLVMEIQNHWALPVSVLTNKYNYSGGPFLSYSYTKAHPKTMVFTPDTESESSSCHGSATEALRDALVPYDGVLLTLYPWSKHYLFQAEYRKTPEGPCLTCFYNEGRTTWIKGIGHKSSKKTKGMKKINKRQNDFLMSWSCSLSN